MRHPKTKANGFCVSNASCCYESNYAVGACGGSDVCCFSKDLCSSNSEENDACTNAVHPNSLKRGFCVQASHCCKDNLFIDGLCGGGRKNSVCCFSENVCNNACKVKLNSVTLVNGTCVPKRKCCAKYSSSNSENSCRDGDVCCLDENLCRAQEGSAAHFDMISDESQLKVATAEPNDHCSMINLKPKSSWNPSSAATVPIPFGHFSVPAIQLPVHRVYMHRTNTIPCDEKKTCAKVIQVLQRIHMKIKNMRDIGFNFIVAGDGNIYESRGWHEPDELLAERSVDSISIAFIGEFNKDPPNERMIDAANNLIKCGQSSGFISKQYELFYQQDAPCTPNSGEAIYEAVKKLPQFTENSSNKNC
ncbi:Peptidoglycan-recognition protein SC2-like protein [Dinothrombium tinctorium]|uniref:Peptidoglycan-recognition protein SC2-like protein n=1 Tax=Dinothrombium tinctorium TaxID=1965070 RepID=A0A3S3NII9_9ACAR|nr:Peptidoglycan-recognition protein SC2-like protein [Dinothrombium tinctorium]RWS08868.1 Peptidoglycan-recognition protein SC2-like protein [Dinothrombium tinctorium]RWS12564.1 Peptidoglycan-recognition protein SC2-like protein [Dinothrombium tinctorium]